jgi:hypothetical protein
VAYHRSDLAITERSHQPEHIADTVQQRIRQDIVIECNRGACAAPISPQIGRDDMKAGLRQWQQLISPRIGKFRKPVQQHHARLSALFETRLQNVHPHTIVVVDVT